MLATVFHYIFQHYNFLEELFVNFSNLAIFPFVPLHYFGFASILFKFILPID